MAEIPDKIQTWQMVQPTSKDKETGEVTPGKLEKTEIPVPDLKPGEVLVEIAGCGVCHTDLGYFYDGVRTVSKPPLTLGHEIAGTVVAGDETWIGKEVKDVVKEFRGLSKEQGFPNYGWKIFEVSGVKAGQEIALSLLGFTGKLIVVGYGLAKTEYAIGRLMAFDAEVIGTWGCLPEYYPIVLDMVLDKKIDIEPFVETRPMSTIAETFDEVHKAGSPAKRIVLTPDF